MSLVSPVIWEMTMGDMPMPEDCTFEQMNAMWEVVHAMENKEFAVEQIKWYEDLWRVNLPKYEFYKKHREVSEDYEEKYIIYCDIMKMIKEGIVLFREWLAE